MGTGTPLVLFERDWEWETEARALRTRWRWFQRTMDFQDSRPAWTIVDDKFLRMGVPPEVFGSCPAGEDEDAEESRSRSSMGIAAA